MEAEIRDPYGRRKLYVPRESIMAKCCHVGSWYEVYITAAHHKPWLYIALSINYVYPIDKQVALMAIHNSPGTYMKWRFNDEIG